MTSQSSDDLGPAEREALRALREKDATPPGMEGRVLAALRRHRLVNPAPRSTLRAGSGGARRWAALAAAALLFLAGLAVGRRQADPVLPALESPRFVLLLHEEGGRMAVPAGGEAELIEEYRRWAIGLNEAGQEISGEKLKDGGRMLGAAEQAEMTLGGYFIITAPDYDAAVDIARECPHLRHGGRIEIRQIDPV
jgi:hypothetical protein